MKNMDRLYSYFVNSQPNAVIAQTIGIEVETSFVNQQGKPITLDQSQKILRTMCEKHDWYVRQFKGNLISEIGDGVGNKILYELGRQNLELASKPDNRKLALSFMSRALETLHRAAYQHEAFPFFGPVLDTQEDLLVIPDERDAIWLELDGREALELLARTSAVQFTFSVSPHVAIGYLNKLGWKLDSFLKDYPQEENWQQYIKTSKAGYFPTRYGGPLLFQDIHDYCKQLAKHEVVVGPKLVLFDEVENLDIPLFLRSVWWYFRLRRYGTTLCIEVRPLPRRGDDKIEKQLEFVLGILSKP